MFDFETDCVMTGGSAFGAVVPPIYLSSTFEGGGDYSYSRVKNPTRDELQGTLAKLEGGKYAFAFCSGLAAVSALFMLLKAGDKCVVGSGSYGGSIRLAQKIFAGFDVKFEFTDPTDTYALSSALDGAALLLIETPSNPMLDVTDIQKTAALCASKGVLFAVDNTFMTPYLQNPLSLGADIVLHSATKYLSGHHDVTAGAIITSDVYTAERLKLIISTTGTGLSPFDCYLVQRGIQTLPLRMDKHCYNAEELCRVLKMHHAVSEVYYPADNQIQQKQAKASGGMISFRLADETKTAAILNGGEIIKFAESLGGTRSLITHPYSQTHASLSQSEKASLGITPGLLRLSVGIESIEDLTTDLLNMLNV